MPFRRLLGCRVQLRWKNLTSDSPDCRVVEGGHHALQPSGMKDRVVVRVYQDRTGCCGGAGVARDVQPGPVLTDVSHARFKRDASGPVVDGGVVDDDDLDWGHGLVFKRNGGNGRVDPAGHGCR